MPRKTAVNKPGFEEGLKRLEEIVAKLESGIPLEEAALLYQEGIGLSAALEERLSSIERQVYEVKNMKKLASGEDSSMDLALFE